MAKSGYGEKHPGHPTKGEHKEDSQNSGHSVVGETTLSGAVGSLHRQHPIQYDDHGPHHGSDHHVRHAPAVMPNKSHPYNKG